MSKVEGHDSGPCPSIDKAKFEGIGTFTPVPDTSMKNGAYAGNSGRGDLNTGSADKLKFHDDKSEFIRKP